jgi:putative nucleotidyltransferase with HDIG domain
MANLESIIKRARSLPTLPAVTMKLLKVVDDSTSQAKDVGKIIESDQSLAAQVLKQVNSPFYGFSGRIATLQHAVVIMGYNAIKNLAMGVSISMMARKETTPLIDSEMFWEHSLGVGVLARAIGKVTGYGCPEELLVAGLLHDVGKLILADNLTEEYKKVLLEAEEKKEEVCRSELRVLGHSHADVGEWFAKENRFPLILRSCVKYHHTPATNNANEFTAAVKIIHLADRLCKSQGIGWGVDSIYEDIEGLSADAGLGDEARAKVIENLKSEVEEAKEFFGINRASPIDRELIA